MDEPERVGVVAGDVVERVVEPVDGDGLAPRDAAEQLVRVDIAGLLRDGAELEWQAERVGEVGEALPRVGAPLNFTRGLMPLNTWNAAATQPCRRAATGDAAGSGAYRPRHELTRRADMASAK